MLASTLSTARPDQQSYCHTNATTPPCLRATALHATTACQYSVGACGRCGIVPSSWSPHKCRYPLFAYPWLNVPNEENAQKNLVQSRANSSRRHTTETPVNFLRTGRAQNPRPSEVRILASFRRSQRGGGGKTGEW